jgi:DNA-binding CsgD family transcriptional regulator
MYSRANAGQIAELLALVRDAWEGRRWAEVCSLAAEVLALDPTNDDAWSLRDAAAKRGAHEVLDLVRGLDHLPVLAFLTDGLNRIQWVNRTFASEIGNPIKEGISSELRFVPALVAGPYRNRFPRWRDEISACLAGLDREVEAGNLAAGTLQLIEQTFRLEPELLQQASRVSGEWDGRMVLRGRSGDLSLVREYVFPVVDNAGASTGFHLTQWFVIPDQAGPSEDESATLSVVLTPRQLAIGRLFASGLTAKQVAEEAGISWRTARDHLEEIYARLGINSRAQLSSCFLRADLAVPGRAVE